MILATPEQLKAIREEAKRDMEAGRYHRYKNLLPLFRQAMQLEGEGYQVIFVREEGLRNAKHKRINR